MKQETKVLIARFWLGVVLAGLVVGVTYLPLVAWKVIGAAVVGFVGLMFTFWCLEQAFPKLAPPPATRRNGSGPL